MKKLFILVAFTSLFALMSFTNKAENTDPVVERVCLDEAVDAWIDGIGT